MKRAVTYFVGWRETSFESQNDRLLPQNTDVPFVLARHLMGLRRQGRKLYFWKNMGRVRQIAQNYCKNMYDF